MNRILCMVFLAIVLQSVLVHGAEIRLIPQLSVKDQYNDNLFYDSRSKNKVDDIVAVVSPGLSLTGRTERLDSSVQCRLSRNEYHDRKDLESTDQIHSGSLRYLLTQKTDMSAEAMYTRDSQIDRDIETTGHIFSRAVRERQHYGCSSRSAFTERTSAGLLYSYDKETFDDPEYADSTIQNISLSLTRDLDSFLSQTVVRLSPSYALYGYPDTDVTSCSLTTGAARKLSEVFDISADIGRQQSRIRDVLFGHYAQRTKTRGTIGQVGLNYKGELTRSSLGFSKSIRSLSGESGLARYTSVRFNLSRRFTYELTGDVTAEYCMNKQSARNMVSSELDETTIRVQPRIVYSITDDIRLETSYRQARIRDNESHRKIVQNLFYLNVTWQYPIER